MNTAVPEPSLSALVGLLAEQALLAMGVPHPLVEAPPPANPEIARFYVDLVAILKDKSEGRRTEAETRQIEETLYQLRMKILGMTPVPEGMRPGTEGVLP